MFQKVATKVLGIIENMSYFVCPNCGKRTYIFGNNGAVHTSKQLRVPLLGQVPIEAQITAAGDEGIPIVIRDPKSLSAKVFIEIARKLVEDSVFQH
jgi:ATP-binding protein involved in chromosome partitioning